MTTPTWPREPWHVHKGELANEGRTFVKTDHNNGYKRWVAETTYTVGRTGQRADAETARRIAAAVNAVKGIPTKALEADVISKALNIVHAAHHFAEFGGSDVDVETMGNAATLLLADLGKGDCDVATET